MSRIFIAFIFSFFAAKGQFMWQIKKDTVIKWHYHDGDEFDNDKIDLEKWIPRYSYSEVNYRFEYLMKTERLEFENGLCKFMCYRDTGLYTVPAWQLDSAFKKDFGSALIDDNKFKYYFTAGNVWSKKQYHKGYFEIRFRTTDSYGMWPAFWMYGNNMKDEIDYFELKGERPKDIHIDTHCPSGCGSGYRGGSLLPKSFGGWIKSSEDLSQGFNVLAGEWQDGYVKWYLNGEGIGYFKGDFASQQMNLIIGTGPAKDGFPFSPGVKSDSKFPNSLDVDYVRVWYRDKEQGDISGKKHTAFSFLSSGEGTAKLRKKVRYMYSKKEFRGSAMTISILPSNNRQLICTALGKDPGFSITVSDAKGKELGSYEISSAFNTIDLSKYKETKEFGIRISAMDHTLTETIKFDK